MSSLNDLNRHLTSCRPPTPKQKAPNPSPSNTFPSSYSVSAINSALLLAVNEHTATIRRLHDQNKEQMQAFRTELSTLVSMATDFMYQYVTNNRKPRKRRKLQHGEE